MNSSVKRVTPSYVYALNRDHELDYTHPYKLTCPTHSKQPIRFDNKMDADDAFARLKDQGIHQVIYSYVSKIDNLSMSKIIGYAAGVKSNKKD